jgi:hypothetical protein
LPPELIIRYVLRHSRYIICAAVSHWLPASSSSYWRKYVWNRSSSGGRIRKASLFSVISWISISSNRWSIWSASEQRNLRGPVRSVRSVSIF